MKLKLFFLWTLALVPVATLAANSPDTKRVLFFSKAGSWEQGIIHRDGTNLSYIETKMKKFGEANHIDFVFSKDGTIFTAERLAGFDAFLFFTSGDLAHQDYNGRGDNYPLMPLSGKKAFLDAIQDGKGFIGINTANYTFPDESTPGEEKGPKTSWRYTHMIGAGYMGHNEVQKGYFTYLDKKFPGMEEVPANYAPVDQWYAFNRLMPDLHVIMALDAPKLKGNLYERPSYPVAWARMQGKGRVYYTTMGHAQESWEDPVFLKMLLGGIRWATKSVDADVAPNMSTITPQATNIPPHASSYISTDPPIEDTHFPKYKVHYPGVTGSGAGLDTNAVKHVLFFSKSAGYEHPIAYRNGAYPCFLEREMLQFGYDNGVDFDFCKDGTLFSADQIAKYDAFLFYTSGNLTNQLRNGPGDNYPPMTPAGKELFLKAIHDGKGFIGVHCAIETFSESAGSKQEPYSRMLGAEYLGQGNLQRGRLTQIDKAFPGADKIAADFAPEEEWYTMQNFQPDLHVIAYQSSGSPAVWARMEGKGRVFYTALGHNEEMWKDPGFRSMLLGALRWTTGVTNADVTPNFRGVTRATSLGWLQGAPSLTPPTTNTLSAADSKK